MPAPPPLVRRLFGELLGSAFLAALVIGSGIAAQQLSPHDVGLELLENAVATAAGLYAIILMFGPISGGHFNPVVSLVDAIFGGISRRDALAYLSAEVAGCVLGAFVANGMFAKAALSISTHHRARPRAPARRRDRDARADPRDLRARPHLPHQFGPRGSRRLHRSRLLLHKLQQLRQPRDHNRPDLLQHVRGIAPASAPAFIIAQAIGGALAVLAIRLLYPDVDPAVAAAAVLPHADPAANRLLAEGAPR